MLKEAILSTALLSLPLTLQAGIWGAKKQKSPPPKPVVTESNWAVDLSLGVGYRHDEMDFTLYSPKGTTEQTYTEKEKNFNSVMEVLRVDARVHDFLLNIEGDYSPLVSGRTKSDFISPVGIQETFFYKFKKVIGYEADAAGSVGYRWCFFKHKNTALRFIPQVGYRYSTQVFEPQGESRYLVQPLQTDTTLFSYLDATHKEWFGPYVEAIFSFSFKDKLFIEPFYQYHFLHFRQTTSLTDKFIPLPSLPSGEVIWNVTMRGNNAHGQVGGLHLYYRARCHLKWGLKASLLSFKTGHFKSYANRTFHTFSAVPPLTIKNTLVEKARGSWNNFSIYTYFGYDF